jgi:hypothetical protein
METEGQRTERTRIIYIFSESGASPTQFVQLECHMTLLIARPVECQWVESPTQCACVLILVRRPPPSAFRLPPAITRIPDSGDLRPLRFPRPPLKGGLPQGPGWRPSPGVVRLGRPLSCRPVGLARSLDHARLRRPTASAALSRVLIRRPPPSAYHPPLPASPMLAPRQFPPQKRLQERLALPRSKSFVWASRPCTWPRPCTGVIFGLQEHLANASRRTNSTKSMASP